MAMIWVHAYKPKLDESINSESRCARKDKFALRAVAGFHESFALDSVLTTCQTAQCRLLESV